RAYVHVDFGLIQLPQGRMSPRRGRVGLLEDVRDEATARARRLVEEKNPELSEPEKDEVARIVGIGAIKYADLSQNRVKNIVFDWDRMLALDGDSAPYLQYTYVRARGILRKGGDRMAEGPFDSVATGTPAEWALVLALGSLRTMRMRYNVMVGKDTGRDFSQDRETPGEPRSSGNPRRRVGWKFRTRPARSHGLRRHARTLDPSAGGHLVSHLLFPTAD